MKAVIMAGGKGTRLQSITSDIPKPMVPVLEKPILEYQIESLKASDIIEIIIIVGYRSNAIREHFSDGTKWNVSINYIVEEKPLGTAGAFFYLKNIIDDDFLLIFGDLMLDVDWKRFMKFHKQKRGWISLFGHPNAHPYDSDVIVTDINDCVIGIDPKNNDRDYYYHNFVNAGLYCVHPKLLEGFKDAQKIDFEKKLVKNLIPDGKVFAYRSTEYVKDMGTPDRYYSVANDVKKGIVSSRSLKNKQKCIFLDRDGTINILKGFLNSPEQLELLPNVGNAIKKINSSEYLTIVATNQPVIARGECSVDELNEIHMKMETLLGEEGAFLDDILYCPHHPHKGYEGEVSELKIDCDCRKPKTGMITIAADRHNIDLASSWYIGDSTMDIKAGINAGMHTILVLTGEAGKDGKYHDEPEYTADNLLAAVNCILNR